jgi:hypothetical protein
MKYLKPVNLTLIGVALFFVLIYYGRSVSGSRFINELGSNNFIVDKIKQVNNQQVSIHSKEDVNNQYTNYRENIPARSIQRVYAPLTLSLLDKENNRLRFLLQNKEATWFQVRKQQAKIQMLKKKFDLPILNHEKWPETVLLYLIQKENFQIDEINRAKSFSDFNLSKKDIENLTREAVQSSATKTNQ